MLHSRIRYFDPKRQRSGLPESVGALVTTMDDDSVELILVNLDPLESRSLIIQGGAYGEHRLIQVRMNETLSTVQGTHLKINLAPGTGATLRIEMKRFNETPTLRFPWDR